jgi:hypothetical protein
MKGILKHLSAWSSRVGVWLLDARVFWNWLAVSGVIIMICYGFPGHWFERTDLDPIKWCGMLFQLAGLYTVYSGLNQSLSLFNKERLWLSVRRWFKRFPSIFKKPGVISASAGVSMGVATAVAVGAVVTRATTLEGRIDRLELQVKLLETSTAQRLAEASSQVRNLIDVENAARSATDAAINRTVEEAIVGGMNLAVTGAANLLFGIVLTAIPEDVEKFLHLLRH